MKMLKQLWNLPVTVINAYIKERKRVIKLTDDLIAESKGLVVRYEGDVKRMESNARVNYIRVLREATIRRDNISKERKNLLLELNALDTTWDKRTWVPIVDRVERRSIELNAESDVVTHHISLAESNMNKVLAGSTI